MIVVDTNVLVYRTLRSADPALAALAAEVLDRGNGLLLPPLWRHEFLNALSTAIKAGMLDLALGVEIWASALALAQGSEAPVDMVRALELSRQLDISAYDAQFVALAEAANTVLVTEDRRLRQAAGSRAMSMRDHLATR